jgi:hypothetical protein
MKTIESLYQQYVVAHDLERDGLFRLLRERFEPETVLYPGCFIHCTPSFWFQHVVYVDRHEMAQRFFGDEDGVRRFVDARRHYRPPAHVRFIAADYTQDLALPGRGHDLVLALYAPGVSRSCARYLKPGGVLVSNDHCGDALEASAHPDLALVGVVEEHRGAYVLREDALDGYLVPKSVGARRGRRVVGPDYVRSAGHYAFRRR